MNKSRSAAIVIARREAVKLIMAGAAAGPLLGCGPENVPAQKSARSMTDPDLINPVVPWDSVLTDAEMKTAAALCDVMLPEDDVSPAASTVGVPEFIDEWVSAPYPVQQRDRQTVRRGLAWLNTESDKRFGTAFHAVDEKQKRAICDDIHFRPDAAPEFADAAAFFDRFRWLALCGFYTTEAGRNDVGYIGNIPLDEFRGATAEQLKYLGLA
jgi:hypothetical protein